MTQAARQTIYDALREIAVTAQGEVPNADEAQDALRRLNNMMAGWAAESIDIDFQPITLDDPLPLADKFIDSAMLLLAVALAPGYGKQLDASTAVRAERARVLLQGAFSDIKEAVFERALRKRVGFDGTYNITTDAGS